MLETWQLIGLLGIPIGLIIGIVVEWRRKRHVERFTLSDEDRRLATKVFRELRQLPQYEDITEELVVGVISYHLRYPYVKPRAQGQRDVWQAFKRAKAKGDR